MGRLTVAHMAEQNRNKPAVTMIPGGDKQAYKTFTLTSTFNNGLNKWVTSGKKGLKTFSAPGRSKGESVNAVKNKIDASLGQDKNKMAMFTDASAESVREVTIPIDQVDVSIRNRIAAKEAQAAQFTPVAMPRDFSVGTYTVRAVYGERNQKYTVSVIQGNIVKEVFQFNKSQGQGAAMKHKQLKNLATKKANYENAKPQSVQKTNYNIDLQVVQGMSGLGGIFDGFLGMFGLGSASEAARFQRRADSGIDKQRSVQAGKQQAVANKKMLNNVRSRQNTRLKSGVVNTRTLSPKQQFQQASNKSVSKFTTKTSQIDPSILRTIAQKEAVTASKRPATTAKWSDMPAKSYKVITSRKDGTVVNESGAFTNYNQAVDAFSVEVSTVENSPEFYDQDAPLVLEVPITTGDGGDITNSGVDQSILTAIANQKAAAAAAAAQQAAAAEAAARGAMPTSTSQVDQSILTAIANQKAAAAAQQAAQVDTSGSENYNDMVLTEPVAPLPTYIPEQEPGSIYVPLNLNDNAVLLKQQATTALAPAVSSQTIGLALVGLAGLAYMAKRK